MKLSKAIANINKDDIDSCYDVEVFNSALGLSYYCSYDDTISQRLKYVFLTKWICTDTWVGTRVYLLDDIPVAISYQSGRKNPECVDFLSQADVVRMRNFIFSLMQADDDGSAMVCDPNKEIEEFYQVSYSSQLLVNKGYYKGIPVDVVKKYVEYSDIDMWEFVDVRLDGMVVTIPMSLFDIPINIKGITK
jgi:hypothetical protein